MKYSQSIINLLSSTKASKILTAVIVVLWILAFGTAINRQLHEGSADFREFYRVTRQTVYGDANIAQGLRVAFSYPPFFHILVACFSWLSLLWASILWFLLCSLSAGLSVALTVKILEEDERPPSFFFWAPLYVSLGIILNDLVMGNSNLLVLFCIVTAVYLLKVKRDFWGGISIACGTAIKFLPAIFFFYFVYKRLHKASLGFAIGVLVFFVGMPIIALGPNRGISLIKNWSGQITPLVNVQSSQDNIWYKKEDVYRGTNQSLLAVLNRFLRPIGAIKGKHPKGRVNIADLSPLTVNIIFAVLALSLIVGSTLILKFPIKEQRNGFELASECSIVIMLMLLLSKVTWVNYFVHMLLPNFTAFRILYRADASPRKISVASKTIALSIIFSLLGAHPVGQAYAMPLAGACAIIIAIIYNMRNEISKVNVIERNENLDS